MHGIMNIKFIEAKQAKEIYQYRLHTVASRWTFINISVPGLDIRNAVSTYHRKRFGLYRFGIFFINTPNYKISTQSSSVKWVLNLNQNSVIYYTIESVTGSKCLHIWHRRSNVTGHGMRMPCIIKMAVTLVRSAARTNIRSYG